ncbi:MAG: carboxypeptidase regulatory-like domain-containing protein [Candidatus Taylorbacteria bacterium]|nr:carboxypeptidase regulatory-like domain-containing protein [Candidatus Taylorbacteria bacterium]
MKKIIIISLLAFSLAAIPAAEAKVLSLKDFVEVLINLGIIRGDKADQARDVAVNASANKECFTFSKNLRIGDTGRDVAKLHYFLAKEGFKGETNGEDSEDVYSEVTAAAVSGFQQKYRAEILSPVSLPFGTGFAGPATRAKLNALYGCRDDSAYKITPESLGSAQVGKFYQTKLKLHGVKNSGTALWDMAPGSKMPPGLTLTMRGAVCLTLVPPLGGFCLGSVEGMIYGTPKEAGTFKFTVKALSEGSSSETRQTYALDIKEASEVSIKIIRPVDGAVFPLGSTQTVAWRLNLPKIYDEVWVALFLTEGPTSGEIGLKKAERGQDSMRIKFESVAQGDVVMSLAPGKYRIKAVVYDLLPCLGLCPPSPDNAGKAKVIAEDITGYITVSDFSSAKIQVISPNGGESWVKGSTQVIRWRSTPKLPRPYFPGLEEPLNSRTSRTSVVALEIFDISLYPYYPPCNTEPCPLYPSEGPFTIVRGISNTGEYPWTVGKVMDTNRIVSDREYLIEICWSGTSVCDRGDKPFKIYSQSVNRPPVIESVSGPTVLSAGESGTWTVKAHDPENGYLAYTVNWGDTTAVPRSSAESGVSQTTSFTHSYAYPGNYTITFTVADNVGQKAVVTETVQVGEAVSGYGNLFVKVLEGGIVCITTPCEFPLSAASVSIYDASGRLVEEEKTSADGAARFSGLAAGLYTLKVSLEGFASASQTVRVSADTTTEANIRLILSSRPASGLSYTVSTNKSSYGSNEKMEITIRAVNRSSENRTLNWNNGCQVSYVIGSFDSSENMVCTQALTAVTIPAGGSYTWRVTHDFTRNPITPGTYKLIGKVIGYGSAETSVLIVGAPE